MFLKTNKNCTIFNICPNEVRVYPAHPLESIIPNNIEKLEFLWEDGSAYNHAEPILGKISILSGYDCIMEELNN